MTDNNRYCLIPEGGLNVKPDGTITPCCILLNYSLGHITTDCITSVFYGKLYTEFREAHRSGNLPIPCIEQCVKNNNNFVHVDSKNRTIKGAELRKLKSPGRERLVQLDIGIGNVCNLTCTFCSDVLSSSWAKLRNTNNIASFDRETTLNIAKNLKGLSSISFKGGEPFNIPYLDSFLEAIFEDNKNCQIDIVTNGTEINDKINNALSKFVTVISISTEATGPLYQYMRGGKYTWDDVLVNIKKLSKSSSKTFSVSSIISIYNYTEWAKDMHTIQKQMASLTDFTGISAQLCLFPKEQSLFLLNLEQRQRLVNLIIDEVNNGLNIDGLGDMLASILQGRPVDTTKDKVLANIDYNNKMRGMDLFSIVDDFTDYLDFE